MGDAEAVLGVGQQVGTAVGGVGTLNFNPPSLVNSWLTFRMLMASGRPPHGTK